MNERNDKSSENVERKFKQFSIKSLNMFEICSTTLNSRVQLA